MTAAGRVLLVISLACASLGVGLAADPVGWRAESADLPPVAVVTVAPVSGTRSLSLGVTHEQFSVDARGDRAAVASARSLLARQPMVQNQHIMGWGVGSPEPSPGTFDWQMLDARMAMIRATGGTPVITLCCAPDWMKGGQAGRTDWSKLPAAPTPDHFADFARLAAAVARRYPEVQRFQVWNELKGFWRKDKNRWDYEGYTNLYNQVWTALKAVNPAIQVGGPYVVMDTRPGQPGPVSGPWGSVDERALDVVTYWLAHAKGADFVAVDGSSQPKNGTAPVDEFAATAKFAAVNDWLRARTNLPIWWSELYVQPKGATWSDHHQTAVYAAAMASLLQSQASAALLWGPELDGRRTWPHLWTDTRSRGGGQPLPLYDPYAAMTAAFGSPQPAAEASSSLPGLVVVATQRDAMLVNGTGQAITVVMGTHRLSMAVDDVAVVRL